MHNQYNLISVKNGNLDKKIKQMRTCIIFIIILLSIEINSFAQNQIFKHYTINDGLSQSVINCIFQDSQGFIWVGTQDGVNRFDGKEFVRFINNPLDSNSISNNWIYDIIEDKNGSIWVATREGLNKYNPTKNNFSNFFTNESLTIYDIDINKNGHLLLNTLSKLITFNPILYTYSQTSTNLPMFSTVFEQNIPVLFDSDNNIWQGTNNGLFYYNHKNKSTKKYNISHIPDNHITALKEDSNNNIWIGTKSGLCIYIKNLNWFVKPKNLIENNFHIYAIYHHGNNQAWLATNKGLYKISYSSNNYDIKIQTIYKGADNHESYINHDIIYSLLGDKSNNLWIGTLNGLDRTNLKPKKFKLYRKSNNKESTNFIDNVIASIYLEDDILWVGNWGKGLNAFNRKTNQVLHYTTEKEGKLHIPNNFAHVLFKDSNNRLWLGTRNGCAIYNTKNQKFELLQKYFNTNRLPNFRDLRIYDIIETYKQSIAIATQNGLYILDLKKHTYKHITTNSDNERFLSDNLIYALETDHKYNLWIGTTNGLDVLNLENNRITHIKRESKKSNTLCGNFIVSLYQDHLNNMWIGTKTGLNKFNPNDSTFAYYSREQKLPSNIIYEIIEDDLHNMWFATGRGLSVLLKNDSVFKNFDINDGLQSLEFNLNAIYKSQKGELFFGGMNGINAFYPDSLKMNKHIPNIVFTKIKFTNTENTLYNIPNNDTIQLKHNQNSFTIYCAALEFTDPDENLYRYRIKEISENWINLNNRNFIPITNLTHGKYTFEIQASNNDKVWSKNNYQIHITIKPPIWKSAIAIIFYIFVLTLIILLIIRLREKKLVKEKSILENKVKQRTIQITQQKNEIEKSYKNIQMLNKIGQEITEHLSLNKIIEVLYKNINNLMDSSIFAVGLHNPETNSIEFKNTKENGKTLSDYSISLNASRPAIECFKKQNVLHINNLKNHEKYGNQPAIEGELPESLIYLPLISKNTCIGVISVQSFKPFIYKDYHVDLLKNIAIYTAIALENANSYKKIELQKDEIALSHTQITDSINYAQKIQNAVFPNPQQISSFFPNHFLFFKPKQIVSGDFFWMKPIKDFTFFAVADSTGHGVPGAFVSMLGNSYLNEIVNNSLLKPNEILEQLREKFKRALKQSFDPSSHKDGLDIALCKLDTKNQKLEFAGANNPLYIYRKNNLIIIPATKNPISIYLKEKNFKNHQVKLENKDVIYLFSDGYIDQFGGEKGEKFKRYRFKNLLKDIGNKTVNEQYTIIENKLNYWLGKKYKQLDDIMIFGCKIQ